MLEPAVAQSVRRTAKIVNAMTAVELRVIAHRADRVVNRSSRQRPCDARLAAPIAPAPEAQRQASHDDDDQHVLDAGKSEHESMLQRPKWDEIKISHRLRAPARTTASL